MIAYDSSLVPLGEKYFCAFAGRRDGKNFVYSEEELKAKYAENIKMTARVPEALSNTMGNTLFIAAFKTKKAMNEFYSDALKIN